MLEVQWGNAFLLYWIIRWIDVRKTHADGWEFGHWWPVTKYIRGVLQRFGISDVCGLCFLGLGKHYIIRKGGDLRWSLRPSCLMASGVGWEEGHRSTRQRLCSSSYRQQVARPKSSIWPLSTCQWFWIWLWARYTSTTSFVTVYNCTSLAYFHKDEMH